MKKEIEKIENIPPPFIEKINQITFEIKEIPKGWSGEIIIRAIMNIFPYGGLFEKLIFANKDKREIRQIMYFLYIIAAQMKNIQSEKLDRDFLLSNEAYVLFKKTLEKVKMEGRETKIQLLKNFILKSSLFEKFAPREGIDKEYILSKLDRLDILHFQIIKWYFDNKFLESNQIGSEYRTKKKKLKKFTKYYKEFENDLMVNGLLEDVSAGRIGGGHSYIPSNLCKVIYIFIKYDEIKS